MAGPSEAAKEPTMEEILASIRRIISEDDGAREQPDEANAEADEPEQVEEFEEETVEEVVAEAAPFTAPEPEPEAPVAQAEERETSNPDDERYASIASVFMNRRPVTVDDEDDDEYYEDDEEEFEAEAAAAPVSVFHPEVVSDNTAFEVEVEEDELDEPVAFGTEEPTEPEWSQSDYEPEVASVADFEQEGDFEDAVEDELETMVEDELLSPSTQNQVANMLGQLSQGVTREDAPRPQTAGGNTSVEDMVREMLRPMLQQWLDQNLPGMVERMVEREIRRVTRGR